MNRSIPNTSVYNKATFCWVQMKLCQNHQI